MGMEEKRVRDLMVAVDEYPTVRAEQTISEAREGRGATGGGYQLAGRSLSEVERDLIRENLELMDGNREKTARLLGIGERTLYRKIKEYGLS